MGRDAKKYALGRVRLARFTREDHAFRKRPEATVLQSSCISDSVNKVLKRSDSPRPLSLKS